MKPTLRALPGQTFDDGTTVNPDFNVQAPKDASTYAGGTRLEYPLGTRFCSTALGETISANGVHFYTVYEDQNKTPDFHPVSDDPDFAYVSPAHKNEAMNIAYLKFITFGDQVSEEADSAMQKASKKGAKQATRRPADAKGNAVPVSPNWMETYDDQTENESNLIVLWMKKFLNERGIRTMAVRPKVDSEVKNIVANLLSAGEGVETITSRVRFDRICKEQKMDAMGLTNIAKGPLRWYLDELLREHTKGTECTAGAFDMATGLDDTMFIVTANINNLLGVNSTVTSDDEKNLKKALEDGWCVDDIIKPDIATQKGTLAELCEALASGEIPMPTAGKTGASFIDSLLSNKKNARPKDKDGFHVDETVWKLILRNLYRHKNTLLLGETGTGKTEIVRLLCEKTGTPFTLIPMGAITDPTEQLVGKMDFDPATTGTKFDWADFANAIQRPGVVLLDEINRCPRNGYNILFSVLDGTRTLVASGAKSTDQRQIKVNPDCVFFATANIGTRYVGADEMDAALVNRFISIELDYLSVKAETTILMKRTGVTEDDAENIAIVAANIRKNFANDTIQHSVSTRETLECAALVADGFEVEEAMELAFLPNFERGATDKDPNCERGTVRAIIAARFNS